LVGLINHENSEVRECVLDLLAGMVGPPAQATPALAQRLDREQDRDAQMRIIAMLGRIGPAAREAVPVLIRYTRHDDVNVRRDAIAALKQISPADAAQIPETAGEP
jgi:HEAT repeat protein